jgi:hypothetical protein
MLQQPQVQWSWSACLCRSGWRDILSFCAVPSQALTKKRRCDPYILAHPRKLKIFSRLFSRPPPRRVIYFYMSLSLFPFLIKTHNYTNTTHIKLGTLTQQLCVKANTLLLEHLLVFYTISTLHCHVTHSHLYNLYTSM